MNVLLATELQKTALEGTYDNEAVLKFIPDINGKWVVNMAVLIDDNFIAIREQLQDLPLIDFEPKEYSI